MQISAQPTGSMIVGAIISAVFIRPMIDAFASLSRLLARARENLINAEGN